MITDQTSIETTLYQWISILDNISKVELDVELPSEVIEQALAERQNLITQLQEIDGTLREISALRRSGWSGAALKDPAAIEELVGRGCALLDTISSADSVNIEKAKGKRTELLGQLKQHALGQSYSASSTPIAEGPPLIVDSKL